MINIPSKDISNSSNWSEHKAKLKAEHPSLIDSDLKYNIGEKEVMLKRIQIKLGMTKEELAAVIAAL